MLVKINRFYKVNIDKTKSLVIKDDYELKDLLGWIGVGIVGLLCNIGLLWLEISIIVCLLYAVPLAIGMLYELYLIKQYKSLISYRELEGQDENILKVILKIFTIRLFNVLFVAMAFIPLMVIAALKDNVKYSAYIDLVNRYSIVLYIITIFISIIMFKGGNIAGRKMSARNREKEFTGKKEALFIAPLIGVSVIVVMLFLRRFLNKIQIMSILFILVPFAIPFAIGKKYFILKHFNKLVDPNDDFIDYKF
ncbi:MAG: hypothetical protein K2L08_05150 [Erysipelotrichaceae bacterium]|nr:hypothetical protein [Erysipelotrichaceae bacterium]